MQNVKTFFHSATADLNYYGNVADRVPLPDPKVALIGWTFSSIFSVCFRFFISSNGAPRKD